MFKIKGKYANAILYLDQLDSGAIGRLQTFLNQECMKGNIFRIMPDAHDSSGCVVGTTFTLSENKVIPNIVGGDIGCGMYVAKLKEKRIELPKLDSIIHKEIPSGALIRKQYHKFANDIDLSKLKCQKHINLDKAYYSIGTLGGGNHFIELDRDKNNNIYLVIHTGSRNLGQQVAEYYQKAAYDYHDGKISYHLAYLEKDLFDDYLYDMKLVIEFANLNRLAIADTIFKNMRLHEVDNFTTLHNYIDIENRIVRKGAISAKRDEKLIIPINMRDGSLLCVGKGNKDWNDSAPHGAGRLMSRSEAKNNISLSEFQKTMKEANIFSTSICKETIDESPFVYKPMDEIIKNIKDTVDVMDVVKPIYNFKSSSK